ncbi:FHA domain-containing protein [Agarilytica rhodophyticola]|uniref:FHA domain-containing protein n=1 Tax=Agarilytica rhodophyticola TaxID=1737490 RepID=UPI00131A1407|nr:FHA domain-containing protein [Agarilytica rhodophyticola]
MGLITTLDKSRSIYLKSNHTLGRDMGAADTLLTNPLCSRIHCILSYNKDSWVIEDKSKNGTWLNKKSLPKGKTKLSVGDKITFPGESKEAWLFSDDRAPKPVLVDKDSERYVELDDHCNILPSEGKVELLITKQDNSWMVEEGERVYNIRHGSTLMFADQLWHFYPNDVIFNTVTQIIKRADVSLPTLTFNVSLNEENVGINASSDTGQKDFGYKAHHSLLLELARRCIDDEKSGIAVSEHGWLSTDLLISALGIEPTHLNLLIYRSRKAFESSGLDFIPIERRQGEIRLSPCKLSIKKGDAILNYDRAS